SMRLEKNWGVWTMDFRPDFDAAESGLSAFIDWNKDFVGKEAAAKAHDRGPARKLVGLMIDVHDRDVVGDEALLKAGAAVGYISSGGYGHRARKSLALGYVPVELAGDGTVLDVEIDGQMFSAVVTIDPLYDPNGDLMRS
ncbi:MAG: aminomethyl transferase family protein, partial [Mesorhizobium sp.]